MHDLADLVLNRKGARSYADLAKAAGGKPTAGRFQQIAQGPLLAFPAPDTIRGIAAALDVSPHAVYLAAARSLGLDDAADQSAAS